MTIGASRTEQHVDYFALHSRKKRTIDVEMLDYTHVAKCEDLDELKGILVVLRSGKEGRYPELERATEDRILTLLPERERCKIERMRAEPSASEVSSVKEDLESWAAAMDKKSRALQQHKPRNTVVPPVRGQTANAEKGSTPTVNGPSKPLIEEVGGNNQKEKPRAIPAYDFRAWEKYDVDEALAEIDGKEDVRREQAEQQHRDREKRAQERKKELASLPEWFDVDELSPEVREVYALQEKQKGNECIKANETDEAVLHYTRSIAFVDSDAVLYANRALAHLRLKSFSIAEQDCSRAVLLDPTYVKAWSRRGMVRFRRGKYAEAVEDFEEALRLDPDNKEISSLLKKTMSKWEQVDGTVAASNQTTNGVDDSPSGDTTNPSARFEIMSDADEKEDVAERQEAASRQGFTRFQIIEDDEDDSDDDDAATKQQFTRFEVIEEDE